MWGGNGRFINDGTIDVSAKSLVVSANNAGDQNAFFWNQDNGVINFDHDSASAVKVTHSWLTMAPSTSVPQALLTRV